MPTAERAGQSIYWEESGPHDAPPLLLVMGLGLSARSWDELPGRLSNRFRVIVFDNRGTGRSSKRARPFRMADLADDAAAVLRAAGVSEAAPAFVFGISLGGMIAQELALSHPRLVKALALGATNYGALRGKWATPRAMLSFLVLVTLGPGKNARRLGKLCVSAGFPDREGTAWQRWAKGLDPAGALMSLLQLRAVLGHSARRRLGTLQMPVLVITGDQDLIIPHGNSRLIQALIPGARLVVLEGAGHVFPLEQPEKTVDALVEHFLARPA